MPMLRSLTLIPIACILLYSTNSFALSLGNMRTQSALNERFQAEIELNATNIADLDTLRVALAAPADFARVGLDRPFFLHQLKFKPVKKADGSSIIKVTSNKSIREPFLDFLIEVNWPKGRIAKKFTVLLDPRVHSKHTLVAPTISLPNTSLNKEKLPTPKPNTALAQQTSPTRSQPPVTPQTTSKTTTSIKQFGPIQRGNTLMQIAEALKADGVRAEQLAKLLFRHNPQAFIRNNKNLLKAGAILHIPYDSIVLIRPTDNLPSPPLLSTKLKTTPPHSIVTNESTISKGQLRISEQPPSTDLLMVREANEVNRKETEELRSKIKELESQLIDIRQLLKLKSKQLEETKNANTQTAMVTEQLPIQSSITTNTTIDTTHKSNKSKTKTSAYTTAPIVSHQSPIQSQPIAKAIEPSMMNDWLKYLNNIPNVISTIDINYLTNSLPTITTPTITIPNITLPDVKLWLPNETTFTTLNAVASDPMYQIWLGSGTLFILLAIATTIWFKIKRTVVSENKMLDESELFATNSDLPRPNLLEEHSLSTMTKKPEAPGDTSFITDFSPSEIDEGQQETGEVDPAAEADVYIAYGRYQQAENLISQTLDRFPDRTDLKLKLLEIHYTTRNVASFTNMVEDMNADGIATSNPQAWNRICSMGQDLLPGHALFGTSDRSTEPRRSVGIKAQEHTLLKEHTLETDEMGNFDLNLDTVLSEIPSISGLEALRSKSIQSIETAPQIPSKIPSPIVPSKIPQPTITAKSNPVITVPSSFANGIEQEIELDLDLSGLPSLNDIDLGVLNFGDDTGIGIKETKTNSPSPAQFTATKSSISAMEEEDVPAFDLHDLGIGSDFETIAPQNKQTSSTNNFNDSSEAIETKLDLARAYMDFDGEMAKGILEEVLREGNAEQQTVAKDLLASIR